MSDAKTFGDLVDTFGRGWEDGDVDVLVSVFAADAVYVETPFAPHAHGLEAIREAWKGVRVNHADVKFQRGEIYVAGPWFSTEIKCTFRRRRTGEPVDARAAMFCETKEGKLAEMRLYWHRQVAGKETTTP